MKRARVKVAAEKGDAVYHCITRTVNGERLLDDVAKEVLRQQLWQVADFCGVEILTYTIMSNHFHVLVRVPLRESVADPELLRRYRVLYPKPTRYQHARLEVVIAHLQRGDGEADAWRRRMLAMMNDVSQFMKLLKQRFTLWFNHNHHRYGTLWAERFKSVLIEADDHVLRTVAAYIDLNAVRANIVDDPKDYRFCGYGEAVAGRPQARVGLRSLTHGRSWTQSHSAYRQMLYGVGTAARATGAPLSREVFERVVAEGGRLPLATALRLRWRFFTDGTVLGGKAFVSAYRSSDRPETEPPRPPEVTDWGGLVTAHQLRGPSWG